MLKCKWLDYQGGGFYHPKFDPEYDAPEKKRLSEILTDMGIDFIKKHKAEPFFLFISDKRKKASKN